MICATHVHAAVLEATPAGHPLEAAAPQTAEDEPVAATTGELDVVSVSCMLDDHADHLTCKKC